ncbi:MAG: hypothetical protein QOG99_2627 [Frankiales bacterium]|nr:hypothetical protein [Frankiales bacterium]
MGHRIWPFRVSQSGDQPLEPSSFGSATRSATTAMAGRPVAAGSCSSTRLPIGTPRSASNGVVGVSETGNADGAPSFQVDPALWPS